MARQPVRVYMALFLLLLTIAVAQWLVAGLQRPSSARQSLAARQKELSEEHRMTLKRLKCIENKQNLCNFPFFTHFFLFFFQFFLLFSLFFCFFLLFFSIFLSPSARQRWTARQNGPSIEGPEGPPPTAMLAEVLKLLRFASKPENFKTFWYTIQLAPITNLNQNGMKITELPNSSSRKNGVTSIPGMAKKKKSN